MRFLVPRVALIRLLRVVCHAGHPLLRIEALAGVLTLTCGDTEAGCEAAISQPGVCFLRHSKLKKLLQSYHSDAGQSAAIEIEVTPEGIRVGRTTVSRDGWEISLFANPATAPRTLRFRLPREDEPETDSQMLLPFVLDRTASPAPASFSCRSIQP
ncbi:MAG: hypothetical protein NTW41_05280 [Verrucomicrobia bacterium]|nr:hypothetical protein [Verrucomicrobiota bacterium]